MEEAAANWRFDQIHEDRPFHDGAGHYSATRSLQHPYHYRDGVTIFVSAEDLGLGGNFLRSDGPGDGRNAEPDDEPEGQ